MEQQYGYIPYQYLIFVFHVSINILRSGPANTITNALIITEDNYITLIADFIPML